MGSYNYCCVCGKSEVEVRKLHNMPQNHEKLKVWLKVMGLQGPPDGYSKNKRICNYHFTPDCYRTPISVTLNRNAVPTLYPFVKDKTAVCNPIMLCAHDEEETLQKKSHQPIVESVKEENLIDLITLTPQEQMQSAKETTIPSPLPLPPLVPISRKEQSVKKSEVDLRNEVDSAKKKKIENETVQSIVKTPQDGTRTVQNIKTVQGGSKTVQNVKTPQNISKPVQNVKALEDVPKTVQNVNISHDVLVAIEKEKSLQGTSKTQGSGLQFDTFGKIVAIQLKQLPLQDALELQLQIQNLITQRRLSLNSPNTPASIVTCQNK